jgi:hypothetical protein
MRAATRFPRPVGFHAGFPLFSFQPVYFIPQTLILGP